MGKTLPIKLLRPIGSLCAARMTRKLHVLCVHAAILQSGQVGPFGGGGKHGNAMQRNAMQDTATAVIAKMKAGRPARMLRDHQRGRCKWLRFLRL